MPETKYGKYIVTQPKPNVPPKEWGSGDIGTDRVTRMVYLDEEYPEGAHYLECLWLWKKSPEDHIHTPHTHDFDEMLGFFGTDTDNPTDLCGEIEIWLGDEKHMLTVAERIYNLERAFACREGFGRKEDHLVGKWANEPVPNGPYEGEMIDPEKWDIMLDDYYRLRGWSSNGVPGRSKLAELGLEFVAEELERLNVD